MKHLVKALGIVAIAAAVLATCSNPYQDPDVAPVPGDHGTIAVGDVTKTTVSLTWTPAVDNDTAQPDLEYQVVQSSSENIGTVENADANGTVAQEWLKTDEAQISGLSGSTTYYFNVLVRDEDGNTATYTAVELTTFTPSLLVGTNAGGAQTLFESRLDGSGVTELITPASVSLTYSSVSHYAPEDTLFIVSYGDDLLISAQRDGTNQKTILDSTVLTGPASVAVDAKHRKLYVVDQGNTRIIRANLDGTFVEELIGGLDSPLDIDIDVDGGKIYWTDFGGTSAGVWRANLDGSNSEHLLDSAAGFSDPLGLALDLQNDKIYIAERATGTLNTADLDGSNPQSIISGIDPDPDVEVDTISGTVFWSEWNDDTVHSANLDGTGDTAILELTDGIDGPRGLAVINMAE